MNLSPLRCAPACLLACLLLGLPAGAQTDQSQPAGPPPPQSDAGGPPPPQPGLERPHHPNPEHRAERMQHELNLSPDQTTQVRSLLQSERSQMDALRSGTETAPGDRRAQSMAIHQDTEAKIRALLTPDQATKFDAMQARMRRQGPGGPPPSAVPPPPGPGAL